MNENEEYWQEVEDALHVFYSKSEYPEQEFVDACQVLVDSGVWLSNRTIGETCLFLIEAGSLFIPEHDQESPDGAFTITGTPRKIIVH